MIRFAFLNILLIFCISACNSTQKQQMKPQIKKAVFGKMPDGRQIDSYYVENSNGVNFEVINYGGTLTSVRMPDKNGNIDEITLGFDSLEGYLTKHPFFGVTVGRFANRICRGVRFGYGALQEHLTGRLQNLEK